MRKFSFTLILGLGLCACTHPEVEFVDFTRLHPPGG